MRREGNTLAETLRQCFDGDDLRTLTRKHNSLTATEPHIAIIGHITPREFVNTLRDNDLSGGSVNRNLIVLSKRSRLHSRFGNLPANVLAVVGEKFKTAVGNSRRHPPKTPDDLRREPLEFSEAFWTRWDAVYAELNRERPESKASDATARAVTYVLRLTMIYALFDGAELIDVEHLDAAVALWRYADQSARWLFSSFEAERESDAVSELAEFIRRGGAIGCTRTEISREHFKGNVKAAEINAALEPLIHDGIVLQVSEKHSTGRTATRYVLRTLRENEVTKDADQGDTSSSYGTNLRTDRVGDAGGYSSKFVTSSSTKDRPEQQFSSGSYFSDAHIQ
jgi:Protein of unknown function (DUF3987)